MPRYFFNLRRDHLLVRDTRGEDCSGPGVAVEHAAVAALNLMSEKIGLQSWAGWSVDIADEAWHQGATIPFALVLQSKMHRDGPPHDSLDNRHGTADRPMAHAY
jgi:hypothetical protein